MLVLRHARDRPVLARGALGRRDDLGDLAVLDPGDPAQQAGTEAATSAKAAVPTRLTIS
jgi:hypothetical protein